MDDRLTYGSIIQLKTSIQKYQNTYFFIDKVSPTYMLLISNERLKEETILYDVQTDKWKDMDGTYIDEIILVHHEKRGYALLNYLMTGKYVVITFNQEATPLKGYITKTEKDMIVIDDKYYIDFQYCGLQDDYNIESIELEIPPKKEKVQESSIEENTNNNDDDYVFTYDVTQQIQDYINSSDAKGKQIKKLQNEIEKYLQLRNEYKLPKNQVLRSFLYLNDSLFTLSTSRVKEVKYNLDQFSDEERNVILKDDLRIGDIEEEINSGIFFDNLIRNHEKHHMKVKPAASIRVTFAYEDENELLPIYQFTNNQDNRYERQEVYYVEGQVEKGFIFSPNGLILHEKEKLDQNINLQKGQYLLSKSIQNENNFSSKLVSIEISKSDNIEFKENTKQLIRNEKEFSKWNQFVSNLPFDLKNIYIKTKRGLHVNSYDFMQHFNLFDIHKIHKRDFAWISQYMQKNKEEIKQRIYRSDKDYKKIKRIPYVYRENNELHNLICGQYKKQDIENSHASEILQETMLDNGMLMMHFLRKASDPLRVPFEDSEVLSLVEELQRDFETNKSEIENKMKDEQKDHVKTYVSLQELQDDTNKTILKDIDDKAFNNPIHYLHSYLEANHNYTESIEVFNVKLQKILGLKDRIRDKDFSIDSLKEELFGNLNTSKKEEIFQALNKEIIRLTVRPNDKCFVESENEYYIYNKDKKWIKTDQYQEKLNKKKVLRYKKSVNEFDEIKANMYNDYALNLIEKMQNEKVIDMEQKQMSQLYDSTKLYYGLVKRKNIHMRKLLQYNNNKLKLRNKFDLHAYLSHIDPSPYEGLMYYILSLENDLERKYDLILHFVSLLTLDLHDPDWYYCIIKKTKLMPKFLHRLALAYNHTHYQNTIKDICLQEGCLSENGDAWIHKNTGMMIQKISFDTNYGYDSNGYKISQDQVIEKGEDIDEDMILEDSYIDKGENTWKYEKVIVLGPMEKELYHFSSIIMNILGIRVFQKYEYGHIRTIFHIYETSLKKIKKKEMKMKHFVYSVLGFLLCFIQSNHIYVKKTFPGCMTDFSGYPLELQEENHNGIRFLGCLLEKLSKKNENEPYVLFKRSKQQEIASELLEFVKLYVVTNEHVASMLETKRHSLMIEGPQTKTMDKYSNYKQFRPCLKTFTTKDEFPSFNDQKNTYMHSLYLINEMQYLHLQIEEFLQNKVANEAPLLSSQSYNEPFLVNFCCNQSDYILKHLCKTKEEETMMKNYFERDKHLNELLRNVIQVYLNNPKLGFLKKDIYDSPNPSKHEIDIETIYKYIIYYGNFDNERPISEFLKTMVPNKPKDDIYVSTDTIEQKIAKLQDHGHKYNEETLLRALFLQNKTHYNEPDELQESNIEIENDIEELSKLKKMTLEELDSLSETMKNKLLSFTRKYKVVNDFENICNTLDSFDRSKNKESIILFLSQANYHLLSVIPYKLLHDTYKNINKVSCKHWNLDENHAKEIQNHMEKNNGFFKDIDLHEYSRDFLQILMKCRDIDKEEKHQKNQIHLFSFYQCLFFNILYYFSILDFETARISNIKNIQEINEKLYPYINHILKHICLSYEDLELHQNRLKQSEKKIKTDKLKNKNKIEREVERYKMNAKLDEWSYGLGKRVRIYDASLYQDESKRASDVKKSYLEIYGDDGFLKVHEAPMEEITQDDKVFQEEEDHNCFEDDEYVNQENEYLDDWEN